MSKFFILFLFGVLSITVSAQDQPSLLATGYAYNTTTCGTETKTSYYSISGYANECQNLKTNVASIRSTEVASVPALQYYDQCTVYFYAGEYCQYTETPAPIGQCTSAQNGLFKSVLVRCQNV